MKARHLIALGLVVACAAQAQVYKRVDDQGNVTYSDEPGPDSEKVQLPEIQTYTPRPIKSTSSSTGAAAQPADDAGETRPYTIRITAPANDATVINNEGTVPVLASIDPPLGASEGIVFYLNGQQVTEPGKAAGVTLSFVDRGTHTVRADVIGASGKTVAKSEVVVFHLKRFFRKPGS